MKMFIFILLSALIYACASKGQNPSNSARQQPNNADDAWFCQVGEHDDAWDCIQDDEVAAKHTPTRLPKRQRPTELPAKPVPIDQSSLAPQPRIKTQPSPRPASAPKPQTNTSQSTDLPVHIALSYRPEKPTPILELPAHFFAVQLVAVSSKEKLEDFARKNKIQGMSAARVWNGDSLFYVLLLGIYETREIAETAANSLAPPFDNMNPWIRSLGSLQQSMVAADEVAGTSDI